MGFESWVCDDEANMGEKSQVLWVLVWFSFILWRCVDVVDVSHFQFKKKKRKKLTTLKQ